MELLEREPFLNELTAILGEVATGKSRFVLVSGEAGIGKTSLVERFTEGRKRVLWGACDSLFTPRPLGPLYDIAQQTRGNLLSLLDEGAARPSIFSAVLEELDNKQNPSLVVIEDIHWADESTLDLLKYLGRRINRINCMLIVTYRDDEVGADHPLRLLVGDLPHRSVTRVRLPPLSEIGVNALAETAGRSIEDLFAVTGGNPFFVTEALASKESGVPINVSDAVLSRVRRLSSGAQEVLEFVSVIPARAETWLINETIHPSTDALDECITAGMLRSDGEGLAFRHELARRAAEESLAASRRQSLHALVLAALVNRKSDPFLPRMVHHAAQAGDGAAVIRYGPIAARQAAALNAHREAASHYRTTLRYADVLPPQERATLLEQLSYECYLTDQTAEALDARRGALEIWKQLGNELRQGDNLRWIARFTWYMGKTVEAKKYGAEAVSILENLKPGPELAMAYSHRAQLHMLADESAEAVLWGSRAIELAQELGATEILAHALNNVGSAELQVGNQQGIIKLEESLRLAMANNHQDHVGRAFTNLGAFTVREWNYPLGMRYLNDGIAYATEHDLGNCKLYMTTWRARGHFEQGRWDSASDDAEFVLSHYRLAGIARMSALTVLGHLRVRRGDPDAERVLTEARELAMQTGELQRIAPVASAFADLAWLKGDTERLLSETRAMMEITKGCNEARLLAQFPSVFWMWRAGENVQAHDGLAVPYALHMSGDWRAAADAWEKFGRPYEKAMALADGDEASRREALEIFEQLGARPAAERVRQAFRATGVRGIPRGPRPSTKENPAGLTSRHIEVLALMVEGLSNAEIAKRLFISTRTVDHHVAAILAKLDAHTRAEAVSIALKNTLLPN